MPVALALPRLVALFYVLPFFSGRMIPGLARNGFLLLLAIFFAPAAGAGLASSYSVGGWVALFAKEAAIGILLGLGFGVFVWALQSVGDLIDFQTGAGNAAFFDPIGEHEGGPTGGFLMQLAVTLFISAGGLMAMLSAVADSYRLWPVHAALPKLPLVLEQFAIRQGDTLLMWIVKLAAPAILVLLLIEIGIGLVSRFVPQLNVFVFAQPLKSLVATLMLVLFLFLLFESLSDFLRPENGVLAFLRTLL